MVRKTPNEAKLIERPPAVLHFGLDPTGTGYALEHFKAYAQQQYRAEERGVHVYRHVDEVAANESDRWDAPLIIGR